MAHRGCDAGGDLDDQRHEGQVGEQHGIAGMGDDVADVVRRQARVHGMANRPHARDRPIQLQVPIAVPGHGGDAVAVLHAKPRQHVGEAARSRLDRGIIGAVKARLGNPGDQLCFRVPACGMLDDGRKKKILLLHQPKHCFAPVFLDQEVEGIMPGQSRRCLWR